MVACRRTSFIFYGRIIFHSYNYSSALPSLGSSAGVSLVAELRRRREQVCLGASSFSLGAGCPLEVCNLLCFPSLQFFRGLMRGKLVFSAAHSSS